LYDFIGGGTPDKKTPLYWDGEIPWASVKDIKGKYLLNTIDHNVRNRFAVVVPLAAISR
jgi:type I restriction enzyme S subunit